MKINPTHEFNECKATQAAAFMAERLGGSVSYMKLIKLLYIADREALFTNGVRLTTDRHFSMKKGPVCSRILSMIKTDLLFDESRTFAKTFKLAEDYAIALKEDRPTDFKELSRHEKQILESVLERYGHMTQWKLVDVVHTFAEWKEPTEDGPRSTPIDPIDILKAQGASDEQIKDFEEQEENDRLLDQIFS